MACALALLAGCNGGDVTRPMDPATATPTNTLSDAVVGSTVQSPVRIKVTLADGRPAARATVRWTASHGGSASSTETATDNDGIASVFWTLGTTAGAQKLVAEVTGLEPVVYGITALPDRAARISFPTDSLRLTLLGDTTRLEATIVDQFGNRSTATPAWYLETSNDAVQLLPDVPAAVARNRGMGVVLVVADTATARIAVQVEPASPRPMRIVGDTIRPGVPFAIDGESFTLTRDAVQVDVNGIAATVLSANRTRIEAMLPLDAMPCQATAGAQVRVTIASARGEMLAPLRVATRLKLGKGESASLLNAAEAKCAELVGATDGSEARFMVAVVNTSQVVSTTSSFELRGTGAGAMSGLTAVNLEQPGAQAAANVQVAAAGKSATLPAALVAFEKTERNHGDFLDRQRDIERRSGSPAGAWRARSAARAGIAAASVRRSEGDIVTVKALYNSCNTGRDVQARVVYAGTRSVVLEDITAPRAGTMDADYRAIGEEFDAIQYPLLADNLGDPLAMNGAMDGDGRITMLFTRYVNDSVPGIAGYVTACNFYPKSTFAASNEDEIFYARVATAQESPAEWRRGMRSTVIHEAKHIASFAERFARGHGFEESWLEEATARIAEELYSRRFTGGGAWKSNAGYQGSVRCEIYQCDDRPLMMWKHFSTLHAFQRSVDELTPIGASTSGDFTFYASGWSLVRWAADHYATSEGQWLRELVRGGQHTGLSNLAQRTGRSAAEMLSDWALANAVDGMQGFTPNRAELTMPSWNTADIMRGLAQTYPGSFSASPLRVRSYSFGQFVLPVERIRAFSTSYFSFAGSESGSQVIELRGQGGSAAPGALRLAVVRVQ